MNNDQNNEMNIEQNDEPRRSGSDSVKAFYMTRKGKRLRKFKRNRRIATVITSIVLVISVIVTAALSTLWIISGKQILGGSGISSETASGLESMSYSKITGVSYVLVCGIDNKGEYGWDNAMETEGAYHTDIMAVACIDENNGTVNVLQIPRDLFIGTDVPTMKLNAVYASPRQGENHMNALRRRLSAYLGIPIDRYVTFTVKGFMNVVDALGGIDVNIWQPNGITLIDQYSYKEYKIGPGWVTLNGNQASGFVRKRTGSREEGYVLGDPDRLEAQRLVYVALAKKLMNMSVSQMGSAAFACYKEVTTDMTVEEILGYAMIVKNLSLSDIAVWGLPGQQLTYRHYNMYEYPYGLSYYSIHKQEYIDLWNEHMNPGGAHTATLDSIKIRELHTEAGVAYEPSWFEKGGPLTDIESRFDQ